MACDAFAAASGSMVTAGPPNLAILVAAWSDPDVAGAVICCGVGDDADSLADGAALSAGTVFVSSAAAVLVSLAGASAWAGAGSLWTGGSAWTGASVAGGGRLAPSAGGASGGLNAAVVSGSGEGAATVDESVV